MKPEVGQVLQVNLEREVTVGAWAPLTVTSVHPGDGPASYRVNGWALVDPSQLYAPALNMGRMIPVTQSSEGTGPGQWRWPPRLPA